MLERGGGETERFGLRVAILEAQAEASGAGFVALDPKGHCVAYSDRLLWMWGLPRQPFALGTEATVVDELARLASEEGAILARVLTTHRGADVAEVTLPGGRTLSVQSREIAAGQGRVWAFHDGTALRQTASALRDAGHLLRILEAHTEGVVLELDEEARIVALLTGTADLLGGTDAALQGRRLSDAIDGAPGASFDAMLRRVLTSGRPESFEYRAKVRGERRVFSASALLMPSSPSEPGRVTATIRDVTERVRSQAQRLEAERLVSVGLLAAGVAHEVNNPLAYCLLNLERLQARLGELAARHPEDPHAELLDAVEITLDGCRRVQAIVHDLRRFARGDRDEVRVPLDVRRVLDFAIDMAAPQAAGRAAIVREFGDVPLVVATEGRLSQVFLNLIVNAAQAIPEGRPEDNEIRVVTRRNELGQAVVEVYDTGEGVPDSELQHIFEPFYTTKPPGVGTGLGLAICHQIAASFGGHLTVESEVGSGSVFRLTLPAADGP